jgi:hypothetical protein
LTARLPASVRSTFRAGARAPPRGELRRFFGSPDALSIDPSGTSVRAAGPVPASGSISSRLVRAHRERVNAGGSAETEVPSIARDRSGRSCESPSRRAAPAGRPAQLPRVFTGVQRHRLDLSSRRFRGTIRGRARPYDFCKWMSPRARPRTTRTSRSAESAVGTTAMARSEVAFRSRQPPEVLRVRGRTTDARHSRSRLLAPETWPQPRSRRAPRVARRHPSPVWSDAMT